MNRPGTAVYNPTTAPQETLAQFDQLSDRDKVLFVLDSMEKYLPEAVIPISQEEIVLHLGRLYADLGRPDELRNRLQRLASQPDLTAEKHFRYGAVYLQWLGDTAAARNQFDQVLQADSSPKMKVEVATAYRQMPQNERAVAFLDEVRSGPMDSDLAVKVGSTYIQMGMYDIAQQIFQDMLLKNPNDGAAVGGMLSLFEQKKDYAGAVQLLERWVAAHPNDTQAQHRLEQYREKDSSGVH